jgi:CRP-like cAMP-binding protein
LARAKRPSRGNRLLEALPASEWQRFLTGCDLVELALGETLAKPGKAIRQVYFPTKSYISVVSEMGGQRGLEVALVGNEGMLGMSMALGIGFSPFLAVVQGAGPAWRMSADRFRRALGSSGSSLAGILDGYLYVRVTQLGQTAGCMRFHVIEQRLARWLSMTADRAHSNAFHMTHALLGYILGVRRVGITHAAKSLQDRKLITYSRGDVVILDRKGLERASCECYATDLATYDRILG